MELKTQEDVRRAAAGIASGHADALDALVFAGVFGDHDVQDAARSAVMEQARAAGIYPASIDALYRARGRDETPLHFTVPAVNIRGLAYDSARALFRARRALDAGAVIHEIARSEIGYTGQRPAEYTFVTIAAALREGWKGPVFIQGDHFQINARKYAADAAAELKTVQELILEALEAGFYNIDVDSSTLVDLKLATLEGQQGANGGVCAELTAFIRRHQPHGVMVSVGGEIGEVGGHNSRPVELHAFMNVYQQALAQIDPDLEGISKISVQTGTSHGGVPRPDGTVAEVKLDFEVLETLSRMAREQYHLAGAVQHGASTLPLDLFDHFPKLGACEIHLATEFQNMLLDHPRFPAELKREIYEQLRATAADERKPTDTDEQFFYKTRKKALGPFKRQLWSLPGDTREAIGATLEQRFRFLLTQLGVTDTRRLVDRWTPPVAAAFPRLTGAGVAAGRMPEDVTGLSD